MPRASSTMQRTDSLDPATTCRGLTGNGRPCRRPLAGDETGPAKYYCWQHQDQAAAAAASAPATTHATTNYAAQSRTSVDTLMERLNINDPQAPPKKSKSKGGLLCCCFNLICGGDDEPTPPPRPVQSQSQSQSRPSSKPPTTRPSAGQSRWIPSSLSPATQKKLLSEIEKPVSDKDEDGYIYMFWVTPTDSSRSAPPPAEIGSSLFANFAENRELPDQIRSIRDAIRAARDHNALATNPTDQTPGSVRLKIGRTNNVHRRINEWTKQCSNDLTLLRYYPYTEMSSLPPSASATEKKVPFVHRVEHLIHIELGDLRIRDMGPCPDCGKKHQEWFEVSAEREALQWVDGAIRRWCEWAEAHKRKQRR
ncbi:uncharacterized protein ASPGLDRAFT_135120 [Aspergillus glaucus CBS 516.65]|uniref:Bacteriophage T5 Orf172 DNA-binding domain-containing protein n=1 Tax=Aspergillus glaucus CBS 516.65 TaxID=1160497 RepID=A0A1L9V8N6_ASPGL|nr:hypothetical protein ASPGLDRAFT_135120 [Aspergillus glaucus CBS 516.65]OJJ80239.1 hypothetical protein ASPGLDRAFT_135120 [Aspergillus glaucus CBS 516.65]